jgi:hypothetical protein
MRASRSSTLHYRSREERRGEGEAHSFARRTQQPGRFRKGPPRGMLPGRSIGLLSAAKRMPRKDG